MQNPGTHEYNFDLYGNLRPATNSDDTDWDMGAQPVNAAETADDDIATVIASHMGGAEIIGCDELGVKYTASHVGSTETTSDADNDTRTNELTATEEENANPRLAGISEKMISLAIDLGVDSSISAQDMVGDAAHDMANAATLLIRSGVKLILAKQQCQHGEFESITKSRGIPSQRVSEAMRYAEFAATLDTKEREKYLLLPKKSALLLANAEPALVEFLLEDGNEEIAKRLRKRSELRELALELSETTHALEKSERENEALYKEIRALKEASDVAVAGSQYPAVVVQLRKEAAVLADEAIAALSSIRHHAESFEVMATGNPEKDERNFNAALYPALANVASVMLAAGNLFNDLLSQYGLLATDIAGNVNYSLSDAELTVIDAARDTMLNRKKGKAAARQGAYIEGGDMTRGRGRPAKAK